jgi:uncharacterized protein (TIGR02001 family)
MNKLKEIMIGGGILLTIAASANADELSGNVSIGTDYVYRGISQTDEEATIQGGFDWVADNGIYAGIWASSIAFDGYIEMDYKLGYVGSFNEEVEFDVGFLHYDYPNQASGHDDYNFDEVYGSVSFKGVTLGLAISNDFFSESGNAEYVYIEYELGLPNDFGLAFHYGSQDFDDIDAFGASEYDEYSVGVSKSVSSFDLGLTWYDTDLSSDECFGGSDICDSRVVFALSKSL